MGGIDLLRFRTAHLGIFLALVALAMAGVLSLRPMPTSGAEGNTLTTVDSAGDVGYLPSVTIGADGLPVISYFDITNLDLKVAHCGNAACSAGNTLTAVDSAGNVGQDSSITIGADGLPVISYADYTNGDLKVAHCGNAACTAGNTLTAVHSAVIDAEYTSITIGTDGLPVISYYHHTIPCCFDDGDLNVAHCGNADCTAGNTITAVDSTGGRPCCGHGGHYTAIAIGTDGLPVITYFPQGTFGDLKVAHCGNAACSAGNTLTFVDSAGVVGGGSGDRITIGTDGLPVISYRDETNGDQKVAHCGNAACSAGNTLTAVDSAGNVGFGSSITIGADGLPLISYGDQTYGDLKVARCGNAACTAANTLTTVDSAGDVGSVSSITIGADGLPLISYLDTTNFDLKVAHCSDAGCTGAKPPPTPTNTPTDTPTSTPTPTPAPPVGGISLDPQLPSSSESDAGLLAGVIASAVVGATALGGGAWYARRRRSVNGYRTD